MTKFVTEIVYIMVSEDDTWFKKHLFQYKNIYIFVRVRLKFKPNEMVRVRRFYKILDV